MRLVGHVARMGRGEVRTGFWWRNVMERDNLDDPVIDWNIILKRTFKTWDNGIWTRWFWLRIGTGSRLLWMWWWTFGFHKIRGIFLTSWRLVSCSKRIMVNGFLNTALEDTLMAARHKTICCIVIAPLTVNSKHFRYKDTSLASLSLTCNWRLVSLHCSAYI
jgi:hypothetical protein